MRHCLPSCVSFHSETCRTWTLYCCALDRTESIHYRKRILHEKIRKPSIICLLNYQVIKSSTWMDHGYLNTTVRQQKQTLCSLWILVIDMLDVCERRQSVIHSFIWLQHNIRECTRHGAEDALINFLDVIVVWSQSRRSIEYEIFSDQRSTCCGVLTAGVDCTG